MPLSVFNSKKGEIHKAETDVARRVALLYRLVYGRQPAADETELAREYLDQTKGTAASWERYAQALFLANEFVFVD